MDDIPKLLDIDESFTKRPRKAKRFTHIRDNIPNHANYNFMADLIELPVTKNKNKYLFVITDLATGAFDFECLKNKQATTTLKALKEVLKRGILKEPEYSLQTDSGAEFLGDFHKYLYENSIFHARALADRHSQQSAVESLNKQIVRIMSGFMNMQELETGEISTDWDNPKLLQIIRTELNKYRKKEYEKKEKEELPYFTETKHPTYKVGDIVYRLLDAPQNA